MVGQYCRVRGIRSAGGGSKMSLCRVLGRTQWGKTKTSEQRFAKGQEVYSAESSKVNFTQRRNIIKCSKVVASLNCSR